MAFDKPPDRPRPEGPLFVLLGRTEEEGAHHPAAQDVGRGGFHSAGSCCSRSVTSVMAFSKRGQSVTPFIRPTASLMIRMAETMKGITFWPLKGPSKGSVKVLATLDSI